MKVKMLEHVQGTNISGELLYEGLTVSILEKDMEYKVTETLGAWLLEHRKAIQLESAAPVVVENVTQVEVEVIEQPAPIADVMTSEPRAKRSRK